MVLHWINKIVHPFIDLTTLKQLEHFKKTHDEIREVTPFMKDNFLPMGPFFKHALQKSRVLIIDENKKEDHEAFMAARHLADRPEVRFAHSDHHEIIQDFGNILQFNWYGRNSENDDDAEGVFIWNHHDKKIQMGLHPHHN